MYKPVCLLQEFRHACNQKCLVEHAECFHVTHNCKKQLVKNVVSTSLEVVNKVQENMSSANFQDKVVSFIPECVSNLTSTLNKKKVATVIGMQKPEPCTSSGVQTSRKSTNLVPKRKTTISKASTILQKSSNPSFSTKPLTATTQVHNSSTTTRPATRSSAKNIDPALPYQASANIAMQNFVKQKTKSAKKVVGELSSKAKSVTTRLTTSKTTCRKGKK